MALKNVLGDVFLPLAERAAGVYATGPVSNPGSIDNIIVCVFVSAVAGTTKTLDIEVQTSPDAGTWTTVISGAQLTAVGQQMFNAYVGSGLYGQIIATVAGTDTPLMTFQLAAMVMS